MTGMPTVGVDVLAIIAAVHAESSTTANNLIDGLMREIDDMRDAVQESLAAVERLFSGDCMPTPQAIYQAIAPLLAYDTDHRYGKDGAS